MPPDDTPPDPDADEPGSARLLHMDAISGSLALWLTDSADAPGNDLLTIKETDLPKSRGVTGTGLEWADIAHAILAHADAESPLRDALQAWKNHIDQNGGPDSLGGTMRALALQTEAALKKDGVL